MRLSILRNRNCKIERRPFAEFAFEPDFSALQFDQIFGDAQSQTGAGGFAHLIVRRTEEFAEQFFLIFWRHAETVIRHFDLNHIVLARRVDSNRAALLRIFVGIAHQVGKDLRQAIAVAPGFGQFIGDVHRDGLILLRDLRARERHHFVNHVPHRHFARLKPEVAAFDARDVGKVRYERRHTVDVVADRVEEIILVLIELTGRAGKHEIAIPLDRGHRQFEFMRHHRNKFRFGFVRRHRIVPGFGEFLRALRDALLQTGQQIFQAFRHRVEVLAQDRDLVLEEQVRCGHPLIQVALTHVRGGKRQLGERTRKGEKRRDPKP